MFRNVLNRPWTVPNVISPPKDWENFLDTILEDSIIEEILRMMEEFWMEWKICIGLAEQHEALVIQTARYNNILKMYTKYQQN
ncbi:hypothetical protein JTE90_002494 [Oedothorax gibbosus]|uniref:Uncharacterized protein n=1 Tax=Oedothorax gibbosus TaxID=931172 RepID=A0AAV6TDY9_9ARAC|nr:hypothetical protein JTE90_002494 [Oedothorax gibbosus]